MPKVTSLLHDRNLYEAGIIIKPYSGYMMPKLEDIFELSLHLHHNNIRARKEKGEWS